MTPNRSNRALWTGDSLDIMRGMNPGSVDLIHLDPPFSSNRDCAAPIGSGAAADALRRPIALGRGRVPVAYPDNRMRNVAERLRGAGSAAAGSEIGLAIDCVSTGGTVASARSAIARHPDNNPEPTAILTLSSTATLAALGPLPERGLSMGRDTALAGFDESAWMSHAHPPVAANVQSVDQIAGTARKRPVTKIRGCNEPAGASGIARRLGRRGAVVAAPGSGKGSEYGRTAA